MQIVTGGRWGIIKVSITPALMDHLARLPGKKFWRGRELLFAQDAANLEFLKREFPQARWDQDLSARVAQLEELRESQNRNAALKRLPVKLDEKSFAFKTKPYAHQAKAFFLSRDQAAYALFMDMGTGKTKVIIDTIAYLYAAGRIDVALIVAPNGVHRNWLAELRTHMPAWCSHSVAYYSSNMNKRERDSLGAMLLASDRLRIMAMNVEALSHDSGAKAAINFLSMGMAPFMAIDESTRIKTPSARRTRVAIRLGEMATYRRIMSGAPVTKGVEDLYAQFKFLNPDIVGFSTFTQFKARYCIMGGFEMRQVVGYQNLEELKRRIDGFSFRVTKEECLDLPPKVYETIEVPLTPEQRKLYNQLRDDLLVQIGDGQLIDAQIAVVRMIRMQQVICGYLPGAEQGELHRIPSARIQALMEVVQDNDAKIIVWAHFVADIKAISEALAAAHIGHVTYYGGTKNADRDAAVHSFQNVPGCRVFVGQPGSGGIGLTLTAASIVIYYSNGFNAEERWQSEDRAHRIGQYKSVTYIDLIAPGTIDGKIVKALRKKENVANLVMNEGVQAFLDEAEEPKEPKKGGRRV